MVPDRLGRSLLNFGALKSLVGSIPMPSAMLNQIASPGSLVTIKRIPVIESEDWSHWHGCEGVIVEVREVRRSTKAGLCYYFIYGRRFKCPDYIPVDCCEVVYLC